MNGTVNHPEYAGAYPFPGDVAVLCEGDVVGYETAILRRWSVRKLGSAPHLDIVACGTAHAIYGMSDALGRARPVLAIEDRDFRSQQEAEEDCKDFRKDRERRGVRVLAWHAWRRNEIENYLLQPEVLVPAMTEAFDCSDDEIQNCLSDVIPALAVFQAAQYALYHARRRWAATDPFAILSSNLNARPAWRDDKQCVVPPEKGSVLKDLEENVRRLRDKTDSDPLNLERVVEDFDSKCSEWDEVKWGDSLCLVEWSGKEVLQWLRILLTARHGWPTGEPGERGKLKWQGLNRSERDAQDRNVEAGLKPLFIDALVRYLTEATQGEIFKEFLQLEESLRAWRATA